MGLVFPGAYDYDDYDTYEGYEGYEGYQGYGSGHSLDLRRGESLNCLVVSSP